MEIFISIEYVFDTGASSICISLLEARILVKNGLLSNDDVIGEEQFRDAAGRLSVGTKINLNTASKRKFNKRTYCIR
ncbi:hypothetical protein AGMMS49525_15480 [Bacteroidia bacterium]|nr:hypothetical protein AGMMS49525_15480 [Bacteroidia bacterium]